MLCGAAHNSAVPKSIPYPVNPQLKQSYNIIKELLKLENTSKIKSNFWLNTTMSTKP